MLASLFQLFHPQGNLEFSSAIADQELSSSILLRFNVSATCVLNLRSFSKQCTFSAGFGTVRMTPISIEATLISELAALSTDWLAGRQTGASHDVHNFRGLVCENDTNCKTVLKETRKTADWTHLFSKSVLYTKWFHSCTVFKNFQVTARQNIGACANRHRSHEIATHPQVILSKELGGKPNWLPLDFGHHDSARTATTHHQQQQPWHTSLVWHDSTHHPRVLIQKKKKKKKKRKARFHKTYGKGVYWVRLFVQ